ncbi:MAG: helix-turn-helix domain-containing protein [Clostridia bacterium]|nr:helix-turn-helix domain-containing protein [Clostridia bacterium]
MTCGTITYQILYDAVHGDSCAENVIQAYFEPYIRKLSRIYLQTPNGVIHRVLDEDIYISLKLKLHELIIGFTL